MQSPKRSVRTGDIIMGFKVQDHFFKKAKDQNYFARSVFKLEEIDKKFKVLRPHHQVVDFGYFPGSWTQYVAKKINDKGKVVGIINNIL